MEKVNLEYQARLQRDTVNDAVIQVRCDSRTLAGIASYLYAQGILPANASQLLKIALQAYYEALINSDLTLRVESTSDALEYLRHLGLAKSLNPSGRGKLGRMRQLQKEALILDGVDFDPEMIMRKGKGELLRQQEMKSLKNDAIETMPDVLREIQTTEGSMKRTIRRTPKGLVADDPIRESLTPQQLNAIRASIDASEITELKLGMMTAPGTIIKEKLLEEDEENESANEREV